MLLALGNLWLLYFALNFFLNRFVYRYIYSINLLSMYVDLLLLLLARHYIVDYFIFLNNINSLY